MKGKGKGYDPDFEAKEHEHRLCGNRSLDFSKMSRRWGDFMKKGIVESPEYQAVFYNRHSGRAGKVLRVQGGDEDRGEVTCPDPRTICPVVGDRPSFVVPEGSEWIPGHESVQWHKALNVQIMSVLDFDFTKLPARGNKILDSRFPHSFDIDCPSEYGGV